MLVINKENTMTDGPFKESFDSDTDGVVRKEIITYRYRNGMMIKETASRTYQSGGDYHDTSSVTPLPELS
jgi:hypothetical protein